MHICLVISRFHKFPLHEIIAESQHASSAARNASTHRRNPAQQTSTRFVYGLPRNQKAGMQINVPQCGYCQGGPIMQAAALLESKKKPTDHEIVQGMSETIAVAGRIGEFARRSRPQRRKCHERYRERKSSQFFDGKHRCGRCIKRAWPSRR
jgi:hypothetical protein